MNTPLTALLVGNPNCGKSTVFNLLTGSRQHVGNWPGVTVEKKSGEYLWSELSSNLKQGWKRNSHVLHIVDLPGIYGLSAQSEDEKISAQVLKDGNYDFIINLLDATTLDRGLQLTLQLMELGKPILGILTMEDVAKGRQITVDVSGLSEDLGIPLVSVNSRSGNSLGPIQKAVELFIKNLEPAKPGHEIPPVIVTPAPNETPRMEQFYQSFTAERDVRLAWSDARFNRVLELYDNRVDQEESRVTWSDRVDRYMLSRLWGLPIFFLVMYLVFWFSMNVGGAFIDFFDLAGGAILVDGPRALLSLVGWDWGPLALLLQGIGTGLQTVLTFIPVLFSLFLVLSLLEDSGYMARAAFVMDRLMRTLGLPGRAFVPLLLGFGCTIPSVMSSRTLDQRRDKLLTVFMSPFMSCGARLPVYALFAAAFFGSWAGTMVFLLYLTGLGAALLTGFMLKTTILPGKPAPLLMELPAYHSPRWKNLLRLAYNRTQDFVKKAGVTITLMVALLATLQNLSWTNQGLSFGDGGSDNILNKIGLAIAPVLTPMGVRADNGSAGVSLVTGMFAKEAVIGTMNTLLVNQQVVSAGDWNLGVAVVSALETIPANLLGALGSFTDPLGLGVVTGEASSTAVGLGVDQGLMGILQTQFTTAGAFSFLVFVLLYIPCLAAMGTIMKEIGNQWGGFLGVYTIFLAWILATLVYQIWEGHELLWISVSAGGLGSFWLILKLSAQSAFFKKDRL